MLSEQKIQQSPILQEFLKTHGITYQNFLTSLGTPYQDSKSFQYKSLVFDTIFRADQELMIFRQQLQQLLTAIADKVPHIESAPAFANHNLTVAYREEARQENLRLLENSKKQLEATLERSGKLQKELTEVLNKEAELLTTRASLEEEKIQLQEDKIKLIAENNPDLDKSALQERVEQVDATPRLGKTEQGIDIVNLYRAFNIVGVALLRLNKIKELEETLNEKLADLSIAQQQNATLAQQLRTEIADLKNQIKGYEAKLQEFFETLPSNKNDNSEKITEALTTTNQMNASQASYNNPTPKPAGQYYDPQTWHKENSKNEEKDQEQSYKKASSPKPGRQKKEEEDEQEQNYKKLTPKFGKRS